MLIPLISTKFIYNVKKLKTIPSIWNLTDCL